MKQIEIEWKGEALVIEEDEAFALGEQLEDIMTLAELAAVGTKPKFHKLARCYATMINFAGGHTTPKEVHTEMLNSIKGMSDDDRNQTIAAAVSTLVEILMDGAPEIEGDGEEKTTAHSSKAAT